MKNVFTSEYRSRLFISLHNNQEFSIIQRIKFSQNGGNADIINFIDASYVKTENTTILEWLRSIIEFIFIISSKDANPYRATIWIPKQSFPNPVHLLERKS